MPCPKCNSYDLWDDGAWWGCHVCKFFSCVVRNKGSKLDRFLTHSDYRKVRK